MIIPPAMYHARSLSLGQAILLGGELLLQTLTGLGFNRIDTHKHRTHSATNQHVGIVEPCIIQGVVQRFELRAQDVFAWDNGQKFAGSTSPLTNDARGTASIPAHPRTSSSHKDLLKT